MYDAVIVVRNGLRSRICAPGSPNSSNAFAANAVSPTASAWISAGTGTSARSIMSRYIAKAPAW